MKQLAASLLFIQLATAQFYIKDQKYRFQTGETECDEHHFCAYEESKSPDHHDYSINFVEFKSNGQPWDSRQLDNALDTIRKATFKDANGVARQKPLVFIYVHGWHNNADERENPTSSACPDLKGDVAKFRDCGLALLAKDYAPRVDGAPPSVVGIYLGWQGTDFTPMGVVTYIVPSYMLRRFTATHVGNTGMCNAVGRIVATIQEDREQYIVALMGHSFGARVLENALKSINPNPTRRCGKNTGTEVEALKTAAAQNPGTLPPADLVFYVNAAAPNTFTSHTIRDWNQYCSNSQNPANPICPANPFYVSVTSRTDLATRLVMPTANAAFFWWPVSLKPFRLELTLFSAANSFWMRNHNAARDLRSKPCPTKPRARAGPQPNNRCFEVAIASHGPADYLENYDVEPHKHKDVTNRFWIMNTGHYFIANHGDVWNPKIFEMFRAFLPDYEAIPTLAPPPSTQAPIRSTERR